jgi:ABC-type transport system substrate-binding protein
MMMLWYCAETRSLFKGFAALRKAPRFPRVTLKRLLPLGFAVAMIVPPLACGATVRLAYGWAPETLDPARTSDVGSQAVAGTLFDQLYIYDYLARPLRLRPLAAADMPSVSPDGLEMTVTLRPGIRFTSHRVFGNRTRELTAEDFVYSLKRFMDPAVRAPVMSLLAGKIEGLDELGASAASNGGRFDYDAKVSGLVALDRYTLRIRLTRPDPTFTYLLANPVLSIVPREAVEADGDEFGRRPTGTGPYLVRDFQPGTRLVLERNPNYHVMRWEDVATSGPSDPEWATSWRGRRFPLPDRVEWTAIPEPTTRLLTFEQGRVDVALAPAIAIEKNSLAPRLEHKGFKLVRAASTMVTWFSFNMSDAQVGGSSPDKIALRRAIGMAIDDEEYVRLILNGSGSAPRYWIPPGIGGHDPAARYPIRYDPVAANALLDHFGYRRGTDGYRRRPGGAEFTLTFTGGTTSKDRELSEFLNRCFDRIGVRVKFEALADSEQISRIETCRFQLQDTRGWSFDWPDGSNLMLAFYGPSSGAITTSCMQDRRFDALYEQLRVTSPGPARAPLYQHLLERLEVLAPVRLLPNQDTMYLVGPNVQGLLIHPALLALYPYLDVTPTSK